MKFWVLIWVLLIPVCQADQQFVFAQEGAFIHKLGVIDLKWVRYGLITRVGDSWSSVTQEITYAGNELFAPSRAVLIPMTISDKGKILVYQLGAVAEGVTGYQEFWSEERFIYPDQREGRFITLPLENAATSYPFGPKNFDLKGCVFLRDSLGNAPCGWRISSMILDDIDYGFTPQNFDQLQEVEMPWVLPVAGEQSWGQRHDDSYKGTVYRIFPKWIRVPLGLNLVYRVHYTSVTEQQRMTGPLMFIQMN